MKVWGDFGIDISSLTSVAHSWLHDLKCLLVGVVVGMDSHDKVGWTVDKGGGLWCLLILIFMLFFVLFLVSLIGTTRCWIRFGS